MFKTLLRAIIGGPTRDPRWPALRLKFIKGKDCSCCRTKNGLEVHHKIPVHVDPTLELVESNLIVFCRDCHFFVGHLRDWGSYNPNCVEDASSWASKIANKPKFGNDNLNRK